MPKRKLNPKQARFVDEYLIDLNATQAAIRAGYTAHSARRTASRIMATPHVRMHIEKAKAVRAERAGIVADRVVAEIARVAFSDIRRLFTADGSLKQLEEMDTIGAASIAAIEVVTRVNRHGEVTDVHKVRLWDKVRALELLCRHLGLLTDRVHVSGDLGNRILEARKRVRAGN